MTVQKHVFPRRPSQSLKAPSGTRRSAGGVAISRRCLVAILFVGSLALASLAAPAAAQESKNLRVEVAPPHQNVTLGSTATYEITLQNTDEVFSHTIDLSGVAWPAGWTYSFNATRIELKAGETATTTLTLVPPAEQQPGGPLGFSFSARENGTALSPASATFNATLTVVAASSSSTPPSSETPSAPRLVIDALDAEGNAGTSIAGSLRLTTEDARTLEVDLDIAGPASWSPDVSLDYKVVRPGDAPSFVSLYATIPAGTPAGATQNFTVTASTQYGALSATWTVTSLGAASMSSPPTSDTETNPPDGGSETQPPQDDGPAQPSEPGSPNLQLALETGTFDIVSGESSTTQVRLSNTGGTTLVVTLTGTLPPSWPAIRFEPATLVLDPGQTRYVPTTMEAPPGIPAGGAGAGTIAATTEDGILRTVPFTLRITAADPVADATGVTDSETPAATASGDGATVSIPAEYGVAAGVAAVGAGALALSRRSWREKLLWGAAGLYTRLARPDILGHEERERLYRLIENEPGTHFHALQRQLGWNTGTLTYHLRVLERHGFVVSRRDGLYRRFYISGAAPRKETFDGPSGLRADVLEAIRNQHGMSQTDLSLALGANKQTVNYHVKALERAGMIRVEKRGRETFLYPSDAPAAGGQESASA